MWPIHALLGRRVRDVTVYGELGCTLTSLAFLVKAHGYHLFLTSFAILRGLDHRFTRVLAGRVKGYVLQVPPAASGLFSDGLWHG